MFKQIVVELLLLAGVTTWTSITQAAWPEDGTPVCSVSGLQTDQRIVADGSEGAIIAWTDRRAGAGNAQIFAQRLDNYGIPLWTTGGVEITSPSVTSGLRGMAPDDFGGAYLLRLQANNGYSTYLHRISGTGETANGWPLEGVLLVAGQEVLPIDIQPDGNHGVYVSWDTGSENADVFIQHVTASGEIASGWPAAGLQLTALPGRQERPYLEHDGMAGLYIVWEDSRNGYSNLYAQHVQSNGTVSWTASGIPVSEYLSTQYGGYTTVSGGCLYVGWMDYRNVATAPDVYVQQITQSGDIGQGWPVSGLVVSEKPDVQAFGWPEGIIPDGTDGVLVAWEEAEISGGNNYPKVQLQRLQSDGSTASGWPADGVRIAPILDVSRQRLLSLSLTRMGAIVVWYSDEMCSANIYAQHVLGNGQLDASWSSVGRTISDATQSQVGPVVAVTDPNHFTVVWRDLRADINCPGNQGDIYAQRVRVSDGAVGVSPDPLPLPPYVLQWNSTDPRDMDVDQGGQVYVLNSSNQSIRVYSGTGDLIREIFYPNTPSARGLAVSNDAVYMVDGTVRKFSKTGTLIDTWNPVGPSLLSASTDVAGNLYTCDYTGSVLKLTPNGTVDDVIGSPGTGPGQFYEPSIVAVSPQGDIFVADQYLDAGYRIQRFSAAGDYLDGWDVPGKFFTGMTVGPDGALYLTDEINHLVEKRDYDGNLLTSWGGFGNGDAQFNAPYGIAVGANGDIFVGDYHNDRIQRFGTFQLDSPPPYVLKWGSQGTGNGQFQQPFDVVTDTFGNIYVADGLNFRIQKFSASGGFITTWGTQGSGDGQFAGSWVSLAVYNQQLFTLEESGRLQIFSLTGEHQLTWTAEEAVSNTQDLAIGPDGMLYMTDHYGQVMKYSPSGDRMEKTNA